MTRMVLTSVGILALFGVLRRRLRREGDIQAGKAKTLLCAACHGPDGAGIAPNPPLAGESEEQIVKALQDYKSGKRDNAVMKPMASHAQRPGHVKHRRLLRIAQEMRSSDGNGRRMRWRCFRRARVNRALK